MADKYYNGTKLLSLKDMYGNKPELYICTTNRTGGKTTYFTRLVINRFIDKSEKFCFIYRFKYELDECANKIFKDVNTLFFPDYEMRSESRANGTFCELFLNNKSCGYAIPLNSADQLKKYSHFFSDIKRMVFDEFQSETNNYCAKEVDKFLSVHTTVARGQGEQVRYVPVYMISNPITLLNPYYTDMNISNRITSETKFLKGDGFVLEQGYVESADLAQKESGINRAFNRNKYIAYSSEGLYLNDNYAFIEKPDGFPHYIATIKYDGYNFAVKEYLEQGIIYCDDKADITYPVKISVTTEDHEINYVMLKHNDLFLGKLRYFFEHGCFRFKDLRCKEAILKALSY